MHREGEAHGDPVVELRSFLSAYRADIATVALYAACVGLFALATPIAVQAVVSTLAFGTVLQPLVVLVVLLFACLTFASVIKALKVWVVEMLQRRMFLHTVAAAAYRLPRADIARSRAPGRTQLVHRFFELFSVQKASASLLLSGIDVVLAGSVGMVVLAFYHPVLLAFDFALIACLLAVVFLLGRGGLPTSIEESSYKYETAAFLTELARPGYVFRDGGGIAYANEHIDELAERYLRARASHFRIVLRQIIGALATQVVASAGLLALGGWLVIERELTLGQLVAAELIVTSVASTMSDLGKHIDTYYDLVTSLHKLEMLVAAPIEPDDAQAESRESLSVGPAELTFADIVASREGHVILSGASLQLEKGARVALLGGDSTEKLILLDLLYGMNRADRGRLALDGADIRELSRAALRERVAIVRGAEIVPGTVIDNVRLARREISEGRVRSLIDELGLTDELARLRDGLDTQLGPAGPALSQSQALRLTVARAVARSPGLVAIDADLPFMEPENLERVFNVLARPDAPWTLIVLGQHPQALAHCTETVHLRQGKLVRTGAP